jgi:transcriptional regulator with XRE-family HTH domain
MYRLKQLRESKNMTQVRLSIELGVSQETISGYEIGKATPPADMLIKLADVLDTSVDYILGRIDNRYFNKLNKSDLSEQELEVFSYPSPAFHPKLLVNFHQYIFSPFAVCTINFK